MTNIRQLLTEEDPWHGDARLCDLLPIPFLMGGVVLLKIFVWNGGNWLMGLAFLLCVISIYTTRRFIPSWSSEDDRGST